jgi:hypothetical protein
MAPAQQPAKKDTQPGRSNSAFHGELQDAIQDQKGETENTKKDGSGDNDTREPDSSKKEDRPLLPMLVAVTIAIPAVPLAAFGLPSAGVEPGPSGDAPASQTTATAPLELLAPAASQGAAPETLASLPIEPAPRPEDAAPPELKADLAFALRLEDPAPGREVAPGQEVKPSAVVAPNPIVVTPSPVVPASPVVTPSPAVTPNVVDTPNATVTPSPAILQSSQRTQPIEPSPVPLAHADSVPLPRGNPVPVQSTEAPPQLTPIPETTPRVPEKPFQSAQPAASATRIPQSASPSAPAIAGATQRDAPAGSEQHRPDGGAAGKEQSKEAPKSERPRVSAQAQPAVEPKPTQEIPETPVAASRPHEETRLQTPGPSPIVAAPASASTPEPQPSARIQVASAAEYDTAGPAAVRSKPASEATDVSVIVPVARLDSTGEDKVAIRMVQRGAEIHVSVRTPDNQLAQSLRQDLGKLATGLDQAGFRTETWGPAVTGADSLSQSNGHQESSQGAPHRDGAGADAHSPGQDGRGAGEQSRRQQQERPQWVAELEQQEKQ